MVRLYPDQIPSWKSPSKLGLCLLLHLLWTHSACSDGESPNLSPSGFKFTCAHGCIFRPNLHQVFVERHQWRHVHAPQETECKFGLWSFDLKWFLCVFLFPQTVDFSGKIESLGFLDCWLFFIKYQRLSTSFHCFAMVAWTERSYYSWIIFFIKSVSLKSTTNWEILNRGTALLQTSFSCSAENLNDLAWLSPSAPWFIHNM